LVTNDRHLPRRRGGADVATAPRGAPRTRPSSSHAMGRGPPHQLFLGSGGAGVWMRRFRRGMGRNSRLSSADTIAKASARAPRGVLARSHHQRRTQSIGIGTLLFGADPARAILSSPPNVHTALSQSITTDGLIRFWTRVWLGKVSPWSRWRSRPSMCWCEHPITWEWRSRER
jgi:hypothetical protein